MISIIQGATKKPVSSQRLASYFSNRHGDEGFLYIGYPVIGSPDGPFPIDALWLSPDKGVIIFVLNEGRELDANFKSVQDDSINKMQSKLRNHRSLMLGRELGVPVNVVTFAPVVADAAKNSDGIYSVCDEDSIGDVIDTFSWPNETIYSSLVSVIQSISTIRKGRKKRHVALPDSRGAILKRLEDSIANLDDIQGSAVIETVRGVQRVRGLAGSGKTIVLALKAAYFHAQHPEWKIAVTFNTRSLKGQFRQLINTFVIEQTNEEPDWDNLKIIHAWGAPGGGDRDGLYYKFCTTHGLEYYDYNSAKTLFGRNSEFDGSCNKALQEFKEVKPLYDVILIDEAQDFPPAFLRLCYELLTEEKRLVYAYDELQTLSSRSLPGPEEIFGKNDDGTPRVRFRPNEPGKPSQDIILEKCYRNSRPVLATAHALGFGIYRTPDAETGTGLVQNFDQSNLWEDVGYSILSGYLEDGKDVVLSRTEDSSPRFLEDHSPIDDLIQFKQFETYQEQVEWVIKSILKNISDDELRADDIIVINPDPLTTRNNVGPIRKLLFQANIDSHLTGVDTSPDIFFKNDEDSIVFTGIHRAKGNEAGMVYIINAQDCYSSFGNVATVRNRLFTAITRSKAWVRVLGIGPSMGRLIEEFNEVKKKKFNLEFTYPTKDQREKLTIVHRDMSENDREQLRRKKMDFKDLLTGLETGKIYLEDLGDEEVRRLRSLLTKRGA